MDKLILHKRIENLSSKQRQLLKQQLKQLKQEENISKEKTQLVAYVQGRDYVDTEGLKDYIKERLPDYMIPTHVVEVDEFPRLPNGKIDQKTLSELHDLTGSDNAEYRAATNEIEQQLVTIWENILDFSPIGIHENFFEIGGDSILSIQIVAKAREAGIILSANQLFEHQTIAELALFAQVEVKDTKIEHIIETGEVSLNPIQRWFFEKHQNASQFWNQGVYWTPVKNISSNIAKKATQLLIEKHDALRLSFDKQKDNWIATVNHPNDLSPFETYNVQKESNETITNKILAKEQEKFNLSKPILFKSIYIEKGEQTNNGVIFLAHHLLVDAVSWSIILKDFSEICQALIRNEEVKLLSNSSSFKEWTNSINSFAQNEAVQDLSFWKEQITYPLQLPTDFEIDGIIEEQSIQKITLNFDTITTIQLLKDTSTAYSTTPNDLIIVALLQTLRDWTKKEKLTLGFEKHGREAIQETINVSNTVGWFTSYFPLAFHLGNEGKLEDDIKLTKERLRKIPLGGVSYGALRYLNQEISKNKILDYQPSIVFNYLGNMDLTNNHNGENIEILEKGLRAKNSERHYLLELNSYILNDQLTVVWNYSNNCFLPKTIEEQTTKFEKHLKNIIEHCIQMDNVEYTPSDFPEADLSQDDLDSLMNLF